MGFNFVLPLFIFLAYFMNQQETISLSMETIFIVNDTFDGLTKLLFLFLATIQRINKYILLYLTT